MAILKDLTGKRFGKLIVIKLSREVKLGESYRKYWLCRCDCGKLHEVRTDGLTRGMTTSCGCVKSNQDKINLVKNHRHKMSQSRLYKIWISMKERCYNKNNPRYAEYGERGITICPEWTTPDAFLKWSLINGYKDSLTIDRIDNNGNYSPDNCRWLSIKDQCRNRRNNVIVDYKGDNITLIEASEKSKIGYSALFARYKRGDRGSNLFRPLKEHSKLINVNYLDKDITLKELSKITGENLNTIRTRYRNKKPLIKQDMPIPR